MSLTSSRLLMNDSNVELLEQAIEAWWKASSSCQTSGMYDEMRQCRRRAAELRLQVAHILDAKANPWQAKIAPSAIDHPSTTENISKTLFKFSKKIEKEDALENPKKYLGPFTDQLLEFWIYLDELSEEQLKVINRRDWDFFINQRTEWLKEFNEAYKASNETIGSEFAYHAAFAVVGVYGGAAYCATLEIIGGVADKVFLPMFNDL